MIWNIYRNYNIYGPLKCNYWNSFISTQKQTALRWTQNLNPVITFFVTKFKSSYYILCNWLKMGIPYKLRICYQASLHACEHSRSVAGSSFLGVKNYQVLMVFIFRHILRLEIWCANSKYLNGRFICFLMCASVILQISSTRKNCCSFIDRVTFFTYIQFWVHAKHLRLLLKLIQERLSLTYHFLKKWWANLKVYPFSNFTFLTHYCQGIFKWVHWNNHVIMWP